VVDGTPEVYAENSYDCCHLEWSSDENGNKTYYAYDDAGRVTKTWTDISGQDEDHPLVEYTYDWFGNKTTVVTRSGASATRETHYEYDLNNRVVKVAYPYNTSEGDLLWNEYYQYDDITGALIAKLVGMVDESDKVTAGKVTWAGWKR